MATRTKNARLRRRYLGYPLEAALLYLTYGVFSALPLDAASALGGWIGRTVGPRLRSSRSTLRNIERALPEESPERHREILVGSWDNLGRVMAEYPHLEKVWERTELIGRDLVKDLVETRKATLFFSAHIANWELNVMGASRNGLEMTAVYRRPNNPTAGKLIDRVRAVTGSHFVPKGREGAREIIATLRNGGSVCMMIDQKMNDGIPIPFFGRDAMTAPAIAQLALRFDCAIIPVMTERLKGANFRLTVFPPIDVPRTGDREADIRALMVEINRIVESWVRARPEQWLWLHSRWPV
ncbi:lauroyl acyltransferase [Skermanella stibiiresistens SB22]|uniref:Lauroyl acyltransferase n=1 Tax=Skermanella stibiiresistens SB22 TaxID=1385369 RepID=W9H6N1_9PROT|nr:lauroyl acyltransferase [Skermanella stibiiresistens]EWY40357.1 lauroyl acyltransferase [Skermanella stibiiresistens SB22]